MRLTAASSRWCSGQMFNRGPNYASSNFVGYNKTAVLEYCAQPKTVIRKNWCAECMDPLTGDVASPYLMAHAASQNVASMNKAGEYFLHQIERHEQLGSL
eukprot:COSAG05_NODE_2030_length_3669_cov_4.825637_2_plen_100_part_00